MIELFFHPFSSYSQKVLIALYESGTAFRPRVIDPGEPQTISEWQALWPIGRFPVCRDGDQTVVEATAIIEYLELIHPGSIRLIPDEPKAALDVRMRDRIFDNYVMTPVQTIVGNRLRPETHRDPHGDELAREMLEKSYAWLDGEMASREWAGGDAFTLADCAAATSLFYADWTHPIGERFPYLCAYRARLNARPSFARCIDEARPYRKFFPLGAPDRD